jgi:hypothetical protein
MSAKYSIDIDTGHMDDDGLCYQFVAVGNTLNELIEDACFFKINRDGDERGEIPLLETGGELWELGLKIIEQGVWESALSGKKEIA